MLEKRGEQFWANFFMEELERIGWLESKDTSKQPSFTLEPNRFGYMVLPQFFNEKQNLEPTFHLVHVSRPDDEEDELVISSDCHPLEAGEMYSVSSAISILDNYASEKKKIMSSYGIQPSMNNVIRLWMYMIILHNNGRWSWSNAWKNIDFKIFPFTATQNFLLDLIKEDIDVKIAINVLQATLPEDFGETGLFDFSIETLKEINELPVDFAARILKPN